MCVCVCVVVVADLCQKHPHTHTFHDGWALETFLPVPSYFMCMEVLSVYDMHLIPSEAIRWHQVLQNWLYGDNSELQLP